MIVTVIELSRRYIIVACKVSATSRLRRRPACHAEAVRRRVGDAVAIVSIVPGLGRVTLSQTVDLD